MEPLNNVQMPRSQRSRMMTFLFGVFVLLLSGGLLTTPGLAGGKGKHHDPEKKLQKLTKRLKLSEEQQGKVQTILEEKHRKLQELHNQMKEVRKHARAQIEAQLTPEQLEKYTKQRDKRKHGKKKGRGQNRKKHKKEHDDDEDDDDHDDEQDDD